MYNYTNKVSLNITDTELNSQRVDDESLMSIACNMYSDKATLRSINKVRMFHKIYHLSNITCAKDSNIETLYLEKSGCIKIRNDHSWPRKITSSMQISLNEDVFSNRYLQFTNHNYNSP